MLFANNSSLFTLSILLILLNTQKFQINSDDEPNIYTSDDLIRLSSYQWGFMGPEGLLNEYYGDIEHSGLDKESFYFNVGCGRGGDIISILLMKDENSAGLFYMFLKKGSRYFGQQIEENMPIGDLVIISDHEISGWIDLCMEEDSSCCGEEGSPFILKRLN